ncbi:unnamed protein product [Orchesella dallaii]|uniref:Erythronolide synthase, modules 3 and 4 n=1 Tax=Orchesella dallaii TaxID=48710 RepID=A0ABP1Q6V3_9HEXA
MRGFHHQLWVTTVLTDAEVPEALTLCFSLKEAMSNRKVGAIISSKVSPSLMALIDQCFDMVFPLLETWNTAELQTDQFAKLFTFTLKSFKKCVYLAPSMLVMQNADEIFEEYNDFTRFIFAKNKDSSVFMVKPSIPDFKEIMDFASRKEHGKSFENLINSGKMEQYYEEKILSNKYNYIVSGSSIEEFAIVQLQQDWELDVDIENLSVVEQLVFQKYKSIYENHVLPMMTEWKQSFTLSSPLVKPTTEPIAIIGMSCRYPSADNLTEFWNVLLNGLDATGNPPEFRWPKEQCLVQGEKYRQTNAGFLKGRVDEFDAKFIGISGKEVICMDPQHRLLHELVWEGLEDAALNPQTLKGTNGGVFIGSWTNDYMNCLNSSGEHGFYRKYMGNSIGAAAARISFLLGMTGPSISTESGCSSAMVGVHLACQSLRNGETNLALACGVNLLLEPFDYDMLPMALSPEGRCKTFDAKADGFARAEGVGVLVLKRISDAVKDGDRIWALLRGSGVSQEGLSKSMGTPTVHSETLAMTEALKDAGIEDPSLVSYVETHGTGTVVGDPIEVTAVAKAYHSKTREEPLLIGSVKTNVGHTESCSGITGIMKVVLAMHHQIIPPHRNFDTLNPAINLEAVPARIPLKCVEWKRCKGKPRLAGVSSFGITGTDAHVVLEEPPLFPSRAVTCESLKERPLHLMKISAKTDDALDLLLDRYKRHFSSTLDDFKDLAFTANIGRADFSQRTIIIAKSNENASLNIESNKIIRGNKSLSDEGRICFLFTGQGSQYPGMGKQLYETCPVFRMHFEYCAKLLKNSYNIDITQVLWSKENSDEVKRTIYSQTSIFCVEYALLKLWESWGVKPDFALGHSLGEFAAAVCAGILNVEDALKLVAVRSLLIEKLPHGKMLVIKKSKQQVDSLMHLFSQNNKNMILDYAAINSNEQTVVAGDSEVIIKFSEYLKKNGNLKSIVLEATHAFHSKHMDAILNEYEKTAKTIMKLEGNECQFISGMRGSLVDASNVNSSYWVEHTREKVLFLDASKKAVELGCKTFIEIGPQPVLSALTMINNPDAQLACLPSIKKNRDEWETLLETLGKLYVQGVDVNWTGIDKFCERKKVSLPSYPFMGKKYWEDLSTLGSGKSLHPLLGSNISNASPIKLFQNGVCPKGSLKYLRDHAIGKFVIFPGAGYLEMCLAAGLAAIEGTTSSISLPKRPLQLNNLEIQAPLLLQESTSSQLQTVAEPNASSDWNIKVFRQSSTSSWLPHAKATVSMVSRKLNETEHVPFDPNSFFETIEKPSEEEFPIKLYNNLHSVGLKFGPAFKSIEKIWRDDKAGGLLAKIKPLSEEHAHGQYLVHPVIIDAMIQSILMLSLDPHSNSIELCVPIRIGTFVWFSGNDLSDIYIQAFNQSALLVDASGKVLASMSSVELVETTVKAIEAVLAEQDNPLPSFMEEVWKVQSSPLQYETDVEKAGGNFCPPQFYKAFDEEFNKYPPQYLKKRFESLKKLVHLNVLQSLFEMGLKPEELKKCSFSETALFNSLRIKPEFRKYFSYICESLIVEGVFEKQNSKDGSESSLKLSQNPFPTHSEIMDLLNTREFNNDLVQQSEPTLLLQKVGQSLAKILQGELPAKAVLFPEEDKTYPSMDDFHKKYSQTFQLSEFKAVVQLLLTHFVRSHEEAKPNTEFQLRILEVGAGNGVYTQMILDSVEALGIRVEYTYTDISSSVFATAKSKFDVQMQKIPNSTILFQKLDIEEDPLDQGFIPEYYDLVVAADVIHATKNVVESLSNLHMLLKPFGRLSIVESTRINPVLTFLEGTLEGYWRFQDLNLRANHCILSKEKWAGVLQSNGFKVEQTFSVFEDFHSNIVSIKTPHFIPQPISSEIQKIWLLFHQPTHPISELLRGRLSQLPKRRVVSVVEGEGFNELGENGDTLGIRKDSYDDFTALFNHFKSNNMEIEGVVYCWALDMSKTSYEELFHPYFNLTKSLLIADLPNTPRLTLITEGLIPLQDNESMSGFHAGSLWGYSKSLKNENFHLNIRCIDITDGVLGEARMREIFYEIWSSDKETQVALSGSCQYVPKIVHHKPIQTPLELPNGTEGYHLLLPETKAISDLQFVPLDISSSLEENEVQVEVKVTGLNFRDVFTVIKPSDYFKTIERLGMDFSGVISRVGRNVTEWKMGDRILACYGHRTGTDLALPSHVTLPQSRLVSLPDQFSFSEGATMSTVYVTSILCLLDVAKVKREDVVLIHTASGGVGLSAIEICKSVGCTIIATAGNKRKQAYLRSRGIQHVFNSRTTQFSEDILKVTNGRGVDVVLNSLTSEGFKEATLKACAKAAHFIEMSKLDVWTEEEVQQLRPDVKYNIVDITSMSEEEWRRHLGSLRCLLENKVAKPVPHVRFDGQCIRDALNYLQKAKHIGKVICVMPELRIEGGEMKTWTPMFNETSTYLITGGLGGIGFAICKWMIAQGARHVLLASRSKPTASLQKEIEKLNSKGSNVIPVRMDVAVFDDCKELLETKLQELALPPLKGVMHAAGTLSDGLIINQEWNQFSSTFKPKIQGTLNLHELTKHLDLEHFVLFSSVVATFGTAGQSNHAAGNAFEDAFAHYRHSIGLPATTINWGQWGEVGIAKDIDINGMKGFSNAQGIAGLEYVMKTQRLQTAILSVDSYSKLCNIAPQLSVNLDERVWNESSNTSGSSSTNSSVIKIDDFWQQYDPITDNGGKVEYLKTQLRSILKNTLKMDNLEVIDDNISMQEIGVDSLMFVEIKNCIQTLLGDRVVVSINTIKNFGTVNLLAEALVKLINEKK